MLFPLNGGNGTDIICTFIMKSAYVYALHANLSLCLYIWTFRKVWNSICIRGVQIVPGDAILWKTNCQYKFVRFLNANKFRVKTFVE